MAKKESKVRTSITIDPLVLDTARKVCEEKGKSVSSYIEEALMEKFEREGVVLLGMPVIQVQE